MATLGGLTGIDSVSCAQTMVSRPIVAGPLAGLLLGDPISGMWMGSLLEILSLRQLPIGASRGWDTGPAAVAAVVVATRLPGPSGLMVAVALGIVIGWIGSWSVHGLRKLNGRLVVAGEGPPFTASTLTARHLAAVSADLLRAAGLTALALLCFRVLTGYLDGGLPDWLQVAAAFLILVAASLGLGVDVRMMARGRRVVAGFGVGAALGLILGLWLR